MNTSRPLALLGLGTVFVVVGACGNGAGDSASGNPSGGGGAASAGSGTGSPSGSGAGKTGSGVGTSAGGSGPGSGGSVAGSGGAGPGSGGSTGPGAGGSTGPGAGGSGGSAPVPAGWLYTVGSDNKIHVSKGNSGEVWMGRGVNADDIFLCGYNYGLWMTNPDGEHALTTLVTNIASQWHANFFRLSLSMNSYSPVESWIGANAYKTSMTNVVDALGALSNTYVLLTLRSDTSMVDGNGNTCGQSDDAVCIPTDATDAVYKAIVDSFQNSPYVIFGLSNEPGGQSATDQELSDAMSHAVGVIRAEEDAKGVPHHLVSVQGNGWTSQIDFYNASPLTYDNVVYEYHSYPPDSAGYTQPNIPVIIGEYGTGPNTPDDTSFTATLYPDLETKQIPNLAWDAAAYSPCQPDLLKVTNDASLTTTPWGAVVMQYLQAH